MSRLRFVGLAGTVGPTGLTNAATTHTFTAPLTYANGVAVPTLTGSDYFLLSILDSTGKLSEVAQVTAYNSTTGAATLVRGQEGTTGVTHTSGDRVTLAAYPSDFPLTTGTAAVLPTLKATDSGVGTQMVTVPAGVVTTDYVIVGISDTGGASAPTGTWTIGPSQQGTIGGSFYGSGVNVFYKTGLQAGDTFTVTPGGPGGCYQVAYFSGVTGVGNGATGPVGNTGSNTGLPGTQLAPHQIEVIVGGFTVSSAVIPSILLGSQIVANVSGNLGGFFAAGAMNLAYAAGSTALASSAAGNWNGFLGGLTLSGTPATGTMSQMAETPASSVGTPTSGLQTLFIDSDHRLKRRNPQGSLRSIEAPSVRPESLHATYGDDFDAASLAAKWTRVSYIAADEQYAQGAGTTWLEIDVARAAGSYYYQTASNVDLTLQAGLSCYLPSGGTMFGLLALDASGNGVGAGVYNSSPNGPLVGTVTAGVYDSATFAGAKGVAGPYISSGGKWHVQLNRVGTAWKMRFSTNGEIWSPWTATITKTITLARIGFGAFFGTPNAFAVDYFDVQ